MREIVSFHFGQTGVQLATPLWQLYCQEHGINSDGQISKNSQIQQHDSNKNILFSETKDGRFIPLAFLADSDYQNVNQIKKGQLNKLFSTNFLQEINEDSGSVWISCQEKSKVSQIFTQQIYKILERCDSLQGIMIYHSVGGGFGGSYASYLLSQFEDDFSKVIKSTVSFLSSDQNSSSTIVEPYNSVFTINQLKKFSDFNIFIDNHALLKVCENQLDLDQANYDIFNRMITQMVSSITSSQRFNKDQFIDLLDLYQNLVQLPQLQFLHSSFAPFISKDKENTKIITLSSISESLFNEVGSFMKYSPDHLKYFGANLFFQGDCSYQEIQSTITDLKSFKSINFADWVPFNYQIAFSQKSTIQFPNCELGRTSKTACLVANSLQILNPMKNIQSRFKNLYQRKCFLHWFLTRTDMKESQFQEDLELFSSLILNYEELKSIDQIQEKINYEDEVSIEEARDQINDNK